MVHCCDAFKCRPSFSVVLGWVEILNGKLSSSVSVVPTSGGAGVPREQCVCGLTGCEILSDCGVCELIDFAVVKSRCCSVNGAPFTPKS